MIKGNLVLGIGMIILSIALLLNYTVSLSHTVTVICFLVNFSPDVSLRRTALFGNRDCL